MSKPAARAPGNLRFVSGAIVRGLLSALDDAEWAVRRAVVEALGQLVSPDDPLALGVIQELERVRQGDPGDDVGEAAREALQSLRAGARGESEQDGFRTSQPISGQSLEGPFHPEKHLKNSTSAASGSPSPKKT